MLKYTDELKKLDLPKGHYAIFGSGPMAVRDMRDSSDIDLVISKELFEILKKKYPDAIAREGASLEIGNIEMFPSWIHMEGNELEMIKDAEDIEGLPFVRLEYVIEWKKKFGREKDLRDVEVIEEFLKS